MLNELIVDISESHQVYESTVWVWTFLAIMAFCM